MPPRPTYILGISAFYHDSAACLVRDGYIIAAAQEERFSRKKHDERFPTHAIEYCLREGNVANKDLNFVAFYDKPFLKFERLLESYLQYTPRGVRSFLQAIPVWIKQKLWIKNLIQEQLHFEGPVLFPEHHESHAASAFYPSPFQESAFLTVDGVGEWTTTSFGVGKGNQLALWADIQFPHSLGLLYSAFTYYTGFKVNSGEYKVMGLAPYGQPVYKDIIFQELIDVKDDGSFRMNMEYFNFGAGLTMTNKKFDRLFGGSPRTPESELTQREMNLAASIQEVNNEIMLHMARHVRRETGQKYLCLAGGVALNCVSNARVLREGIFDDIWIQPAAGDAGGALGAALAVWYQYLDKERTVDGHQDSQNGSYLGISFSDAEIQTFLQSIGAVYSTVSQEELVSKTARLLSEGNVIGWFQGRMEFGPRALGARSILGDARNPEMQKKMNLKIKFRESFRPFAPSVLAEDAAHWFDIDRPSPYMLLVADVHEGQRASLAEIDQLRVGFDKLNTVRSSIPAVTHVDYSARLQTVHQETNPLYHALLLEFKKFTGCPVIINTSFNVRGEPIVCSPEDAFHCFMRTDIDLLVMGNFILNKKDQIPFQQDSDWKNEYQLD